MKFGKLLAAGKSWVGYPETGRYQMRDGLHLPKFISPKNPFKQEAVAASVAPSTVVAAPATAMVTVPVASSATAETTVVAVAPTVAALPATPGSFEAPKISWKARAIEAGKLVGKFARSSGEWLRRAAFFCLDHNPFSAIGKPKLAGIPQFGKTTTVQGELSLDRVKVVRNDLSHADLEVVGQK